MLESSDIKIKSNEKGIALLFSLILLALLLVLALSFTLSSMFEEKAAYNSANASSAMLLAKTQLIEILSLIQNDEENLDNSTFYSHDAGIPVVTDSKLLEDMLPERLPVVDLLNTVDTSKINWNYIRSKDSSQLVIGRTAFIVIADGIALDSLVDGRVGYTEYPKISEETDWEQRIGKYVSEMNLRHAVPSVSSNIDVICRTLNWAENKPISGAGFSDGKYTGNWADYSSLFDVLETAIGANMSGADKTTFTNNLSLNVFDGKEAFWVDTEPAGSPDGKIESTELYKRFDLTRDWNTADSAADLTFVKSKILLTSGTVPDQDMEPWDKNDSAAGSGGLPWLACFGYKADGTAEAATVKGTFAAIEDRRCQIAANLKDYCDDDGGINRPTSDVDPADWATSATIPKFTGNEKTPYLDKVGVRIEVTQSESFDHQDSGPPAVDYYKVSATIKIYPCAELINIYGPDWSDSLEVTVSGNAVITTTVNGTAQENTHSFTSTVAIDSTDWSTTGYSDLKLGSAVPFIQVNEKVTSNRSITVEVKEINLTRVVLHTPGTPNTGYDYAANLSNTLAAPLEIFSGSGNGSVIKYAWFGAAVHDPRQNLNDGDWLHLSPTTTDNPALVFSLNGASPYRGARNSAGPNPTTPPNTVDAQYDPETSNDPANAQLSTAYIRNAPMESPWELGFIHRAGTWQTINLKKYDATKAYTAIDIGGKKYLAGGGDYDSGDANILDQIKMTPHAEGPQKFNLCSERSDAFNALFKRVKYACNIDSQMSVKSMAGIDPADGTALSGTELTPAEISALTTAVISKYETVANPELRRTRASVVDMLQPVALNRDADQEEIIGKIVNLTEIKGKIDNFTIIILAQTIKDVGTAAGVNMRKYSVDESREAEKVCKLSQFDADVDLTTPGKSVYFDEITAEQKVIVQGYRDAEGTIKISSFNYVD